jgi:hypothetical protein
MMEGEMGSYLYESQASAPHFPRRQLSPVNGDIKFKGGNNASQFKVIGLGQHKLQGSIGASQAAAALMMSSTTMNRFNLKKVRYKLIGF